MRRAACSVLAVTALLALPAQAAAPGPLSFADAAGDANGLNSQGFAPVPSQSTGPAQLASADLLGVKVATLYKKRKPSGIAVTVTLAAAPDAQTDYMFSASVPGGCGGGTSLSLQYSGFLAVPVTVASCSEGQESTDIGLGPAIVDAAKHTITWELDGRGFKPRGTVEELRAQSTVFVLGYYDEASTDKSYRYQ